MIPTQLANEWIFWIAVNGLPALLTAVLFLTTTWLDKNFGWNIPKRGVAIGLGLGFLMRSVMYVQQLSAAWAGNYAAMKWLHLGNAVFTVVLLGSTCIWGDKFHWRRLFAIGWLFLYVEEPVWTLTLWPRSEDALLHSASFLDAVTPVNPLLGGVLFLEAAIMLVVGIILFANRPGVVYPQPDTMSAKVLAGWPLSYVVWAPTLALSGFAAAWGGIIVNMIWLAAWIVAMLVFRKHFDLAHRSNKIWLGVCAVLLVLLSVGLVVQG